MLILVKEGEGLCSRTTARERGCSGGKGALKFQHHRDSGITACQDWQMIAQESISL